MEQLAGHVLIVSGSPGSGKTTLAEALARRPGGPKVHLHSDDFWGYIKHGHIDPWLPEAAGQNRMIMEIAADVARHYARNGYLVVLDGVIGPWSLSPFRDLGVPVHYVLLRVSVQEAVARCAARGGDSLTDPAVVADLHAQFAGLGALQHHVVDVSGHDRDRALVALLAALQGRDLRLS